jgi:acyl-CoA thioesterase
VDLDQALQLVLASDGRFACDLASAWSLDGRPHGGYVAALLERAATLRVDRPNARVRSISVNFLRPASIGPAEIEVRVERAGRTLTTVSAYLRQGQTTAAMGVLTYSPPWPPAALAEVTDAPLIPGPDTLSRLVTAPFVVASFLQRIDLRLHPDPPLYSSSPRAEVTGWIRPAIPRRSDPAWLITASDSLPRALTPRFSVPGAVPSPSVGLHMIIHEPDVGAIIAPGEFVLARFTTRRVNDGFFDEDGSLWSPGGTLLAQSRQLGLLLGIPGDYDPG